MKHLRSAVIMISLLLASIGILVYSLFPRLSSAASYDRYLVLIIDVSQSIDDIEYALQKESYVAALTDPEVQQSLGSTYVAIIEFARSHHLMVEFTQDYNLAARIYRDSPRSTTGGTFPEDALSFAFRLLDQYDGIKVIDISGDGPSSRVYNNATMGMEDGRKVRKAYIAPYYKEQLEERNITVNALIFDDYTQDAAWWYDEALVNGFLVEVKDKSDFLKALKQKIIVEIV